MNETVNARHDADESAELGDGDNGSGELGADGNLILQLDPGVVLFLLVAQGNLLVLGVIALNIHFDGIANADDLRGMLDVVPAQFADVAQAIHAADVNKGTVGSQALDNASVLLVNFNLIILNHNEKCSAIVLNACAGKNDNAATMKITANVITPKVTVSVLRVPALSGIYFFCAKRPAIAT